MFENLRKRRPGHPKPHVDPTDAQTLRRVGLNPDDFVDAFEGRQSSVLFTPFRHPKHD